MALPSIHPALGWSVGDLSGEVKKDGVVTL